MPAKKKPIKKSNRWSRLTNKRAVLEFGDLVVYDGGTPADFEREIVSGFVVRGIAGRTLEWALDEYDTHGERDMVVWTKREIGPPIPIRISLNKAFSKPLPLP